jgi:hypothetical protein
MLAAGQADDSNGGDLPQNNGPIVSREALMMTGAVATVLYGISALYGVSTVGTCREASGIGSRRPATEVNAERRAEEQVRRPLSRPA